MIVSALGGIDIYEMLQQKRQELSAEEVKPIPFLRGQDLLSRGVLPGPSLGTLLKAAYEAQLEGDIASREAALEWIEARLKAADGDSVATA